jgi:hypothetical protein
MAPDLDPVPRHDQTAELERAFIAEYLERHGHTMATVRALPDVERQALMREASLHASMRLTEVASRAQYVDDLHGK